ncbi:MAG TPA: Rrf2 family transcriptional regulator [Planctomycetia bacterium]|nr:Rrf2 family transcriptional regulator [Planctomycetia bacterium]
MSLISRKVDYGILALVHLLRHPESASARELADAYGLSRAFIANILKELCQAGLVESQRGVRGGYRLAKSPAEVTLREVIDRLDGSFQLMACAGHGEIGDCELVGTCPVRRPLAVVHERLMAVLGAVTLEELGGDELTLVPLGTELVSHG